MFKKILVPLDGSPRAEEALGYAAHLAALFNSQLVLLRVVQIALPVYTVDVCALDPDYGMADQVSRAQQYLAAQLRAVCDCSLPAPVAHVAKSIDPGQALVDAVIRFQADVVVMTSHGRSGLQRLLMGSVAEHVTRHAACPVLIVGPEAERSSLQSLAGGGSLR